VAPFAIAKAAVVRALPPAKSIKDVASQYKANKQAALGSFLIAITDLALTVTHAFDYPAYDLKSRSSYGAPEVFKIGAWVFGWFAILATWVAYFGDMFSEGFADANSPIISILWIPNVLFNALGAIASMVAYEPSGSVVDLAVIATQGVSDILGVPGPGLENVRGFVGFFGNAAGSLTLLLRAAVA
jgi:hypothetical protein